MCCVLFFKIENRNGECVKETTTRPNYLSVWLFLFQPWRFRFIFDLWVWLSVWYLSLLFYWLMAVLHGWFCVLHMFTFEVCIRITLYLLRITFWHEAIIAFLSWHQIFWIMMSKFMVAYVILHNGWQICIQV